MSELDAIRKSTMPATQSMLVGQLRELGVQPGMNLMVHSSLSQLGFVIGGAHTVVHALLDAVGATGTVMMPTHSGALSDPANWQNPPVPESWWPTIREEMPAFDPALTPTRGMGAIAEFFRHVDGAVRSYHPTVSAAAVGPAAKQLTTDHDLHDHLGEGSPQARLYELDGHILLLGVDHGNNTSLHVAERRSGLMGPSPDGAPILIDGQRQWVQLDHIEDDEDDFAEIGEAFAATGAEKRGVVGAGTARLMRARDIVDFGVDWMLANRAR